MCADRFQVLHHIFFIVQGSVGGFVRKLAGNYTATLLATAESRYVIKVGHFFVPIIPQMCHGELRAITVRFLSYRQPPDPRASTFSRFFGSAAASSTGRGKMWKYYFAIDHICV